MGYVLREEALSGRSWDIINVFSHVAKRHPLSAIYSITGMMTLIYRVLRLLSFPELKEGILNIMGKSNYY